MPNSTSSWENIKTFTSQEIPRIFQNSQALCRVQNSPPILSILKQISTVHNFPSCFFKIIFNIILPFMPRLSKQPFPFRFSKEKTSISLPSNANEIPRPSLSPWKIRIAAATFKVNFLAPELFFLILAHPVYKMLIIQETNTLELWNKLHFEEEKTESIYHV